MKQILPQHVCLNLERIKAKLNGRNVFDVFSDDGNDISGLENPSSDSNQSFFNDSDLDIDYDLIIEGNEDD